MTTVLANTADHLVEYSKSPRLLTITDKHTGKCKALTGYKIAGEFRNWLKTSTPEQCVAMWLRAAERFDWQPLYKPGVLLSSTGSQALKDLEKASSTLSEKSS